MKTVLVAVLSLSLLLAGCVSTHSVTPVPGGNFTPAELRPGDRAEVLMKSGEVRVIRVAAIDGLTLTGKEKQAGEYVGLTIYFFFTCPAGEERRKLFLESLLSGSFIGFFLGRWRV